MQEGSEPRIPDKPLETYHPETTHLTDTRSCEACSAFTRVAARTLAPSPIGDQLHRGLQPFRHLHDCSGCFRLERSPGGACTHWNAPPSHGAHVKRTLWIATAIVAVARVGPIRHEGLDVRSIEINDPTPEAALCTEERAGRQSRRKFATLTWEKRLFEREEALGYSASGL